MTTYLARRLLYSVFVLFGVSLLVFFLVRLAGDPTALMLPLDATQADEERIRRAYGFDRPVPIQYLDFLTGAVQGDLGTSIRHQQSALGMVLARFPATLQLLAASLGVALIVAIPLGILSALHPDSWIDRFGVTLALVGQAFPNFLLGLVLIMLFSVHLGWLPSSGRGSAAHLILPAVTLGTAAAAFLNRLLRSSLLEVLSSDYVRTAHAKGRSRTAAVFHHALRNAAIPVLTVLGLQILQLVGGAIVTETVFAYPGAGLLLVQSLGNLDFPIVQAFVLVVAVAVAFVNLVIDLLYGLIDPRIQFS
ncbi:MAG: ABC transporter permease [Trueperaceae bacterium]